MSRSIILKIFLNLSSFYLCVNIQFMESKIKSSRFFSRAILLATIVYIFKVYIYVENFIHTVLSHFTSYTTCISHRQIKRGTEGQEPLEKHKLLYVSFEILARTPVEKQLDPRGPIASRGRFIRR